MILSQYNQHPCECYTYDLNSHIKIYRYTSNKSGHHMHHTAAVFEFACFILCTSVLIMTDVVCLNTIVIFIMNRMYDFFENLVTYNKMF
jgi:hypothetical protein